MKEISQRVGKNMKRPDGFSLNIGSGDKPMKSLNHYKCINIDIRDFSVDEKYEQAIFVQCDVRDLPFQKFFFEVILASDIIEHFPKNETMDLLAEWSRVLKIGGLITFQTPSLLWVSETYRHSKDAEFVSYHIFGGQDYSDNFHYVIFDKNWLESLCNKVGLKTTDYKEIHSNFELTMEKIK